MKIWITVEDGDVCQVYVTDTNGIEEVVVENLDNTDIHRPEIEIVTAKTMLAWECDYVIHIVSH